MCLQSTYTPYVGVLGSTEGVFLFPAFGDGFGLGSDTPTAAAPTSAPTKVAWVRAWKVTS